ncbi:MAG TPA: energy-coupled thiamine transporter ThiT, partial [Clostridia bacterium]|nr:energy-coupled thiamine transporter ThiT [Clostridia bacterium]
MKFLLFDELGELTLTEWLLIAAALALIAALVLILARLRKRSGEAPSPAPAPAGRFSVRALVQGALCLSIAFVLSYVKLFSLPMGGAVTLCSMLPVV